MHSHTEVAISSIQCFADDGTPDLGELNFLLGLALRDEVVDDEEKRVLNNIFRKLLKKMLNLLFGNVFSKSELNTISNC